MSGATGHIILPLLALSWTRWTTPDFQCCLICDTNPSNCPIVLHSTIVQYCINYSQFRLEIYLSNIFQQNLKITLFCGKKWNEIGKESFESFFFVFGIFWAKVCQTLFWCDRMKISTWFIRIPVWQFDIFLLIPLWHEICTIIFILCNGKKQEKNFRISFFVCKLKKSQA